MLAKTLCLFVQHDRHQMPWKTCNSPQPPSHMGNLHLSLSLASPHIIHIWTPFSPPSSTLRHGYLAAGGQRSQLMVRRLDSDWSAQMTVGGSINNALCITKHPNNNDQLRILICNNDETIKVYSLPDLQRITSLSFPTAVNYASVSPDGSKMVVVGDTSQVFLYHISSNGTYEKVSSMTGSSESFFIYITCLFALIYFIMTIFNA